MRMQQVIGAALLMDNILGPAGLCLVTSRLEADAETPQVWAVALLQEAWNLKEESGGNLCCIGTLCPWTNLLRITRATITHDAGHTAINAKRIKEPLLVANTLLLNFFCRLMWPGETSSGAKESKMTSDTVGLETANPVPAGSWVPCLQVIALEACESTCVILEKENFCHINNAILLLHRREGKKKH